MPHTKRINCLDHFGQTLIVLAVKNNDLPLVRQLIKRGANVNIPDRYGRTPLHCALQADYDPPTDVSINPDPDDEEAEEIRTIDYHDPTPAGDNRWIIHALVRAGADLEARNPHGETPLLMAAKTKRAFVNMAFLLSHRACADAVDNDGHGIHIFPFRRDVRTLRRLGRLSLTERDRFDFDAHFAEWPRCIFVPYVKRLVASYPTWSGAPSM